MGMQKCSECGLMFGEKLTECPNCGCPIDGSVVSGHTRTEQSRNQSVGLLFKSGVKTTDTEYKHEEMIKGYASFLFVSWIITGVILFFAAFITASLDGGGTGIFIGFLIGFISFLACLLSAYVTKALLMVYANISINLHEINLKLQ